MKSFNLLVCLIVYLLFSSCNDEKTSKIDTSKSTIDKAQPENTETLEKALIAMSKELELHMDKEKAQATIEQMKQDMQWEETNPEKAKLKKEMGRLYLTAYEELTKARNNQGDRNALLASALSKYESIKQSSPDWNPKLINARIKSTKQQIKMQNKT